MYEISDPAPLPARPDLPGTVVLRATADEAIDAAAADLLIHAANCVRTFGDFHIAIAADPGVEPVIKRLMYDPACRDLPWNRSHLWLFDEHAVPGPNRPARAGALEELVVLPSGIPLGQVHLIDTSAADPAQAYASVIREHLGWREKGHDRLDYVLLGVDEVSTAGPFAPGGRSADVLVAVIPGPCEPSVSRVTMSKRLIAGARFISVVAMGAMCRGAVSAAATRRPAGLHPDDPRRLLFSTKGPVGGELRWYLDAAACPPGAGISP